MEAKGSVPTTMIIESRMQTKEMMEIETEAKNQTSRSGNNRKSNKMIVRYGREGTGSNKEWVYTIQLEDIHGGTINRNYVILLRK